MSIDTTWGSFVVRALESNPSTGLVVIFVCAIIVVAFAYLVINLSKNTELTKAIIVPHQAMGQTINDIRVDQLASNLERKEHGKRLDAVEAAIEDLQKDVNELKCSKIVCPNREA